MGNEVQFTVAEGLAEGSYFPRVSMAWLVKAGAGVEKLLSPPPPPPTFLFALNNLQLCAETACKLIHQLSRS